MTDDTKSTRRRFLSTAGIATGGIVAAGLAPIPFASKGELANKYPVVKENQVMLPPNGTSVLIIGGGLAGLQAAVELSARGFEVTVLEKTSTPGGKLKAWRDRNFGPDSDPYKSDPSFPGYVREHGTHAVWDFYNNLREFFGRYNWSLMDMPEDVSIYNFIDRDGTVSHLPGHVDWIAPYNKIEFARHMLGLAHLEGDDRADFLRLFRKLATFNYEDPKQRAYMDGITLEQYCQQLGVSDRLTYTICDSLVEMAYFDNVDKVSALPLANIFALVAGCPNDMLRVNLFAEPVSESFLRPMVNFIQGRGGKVYFDTEVTDLIGDSTRIKGVKAARIPQQAIQRCSICGALILDGMEINGECPFCGAHADMIRVIKDYERKERTFTADYVICAMDAPGAQKLVATNRPTLGRDPYFDRILKLNAQSVFIVNMWFNGRGYWEGTVNDQKGRPAMCFFPTGFDHLGITINRSVSITGRDGKRLVLSHEFLDRDITIIETQIAKTESVHGMTTQQIGEACYAELKEVIPDLPPPEDVYVNRWYNYTAYRVGDDGNRPPIQSPVDNLMFIGDIAFVPHHGVFMEKTNVTAKWATNLLLDKIGQTEGKIRILPSGTPSLVTAALSATGSVYLD